MGCHWLALPGIEGSLQQKKSDRDGRNEGESGNIGKTDLGFRRVDKQIGSQNRHLIELKEGEESEDKAPHQIRMLFRAAFGRKVEKIAGDGDPDQKKCGTDQDVSRQRSGIGG